MPKKPLTRQQYRAKYRNEGKAMAKKMGETHKGVPRSERRAVCFAIQKEKMHANNAKRKKRAQAKKAA